MHGTILRLNVEFLFNFDIVHCIMKTLSEKPSVIVHCALQLILLLL